jgi:FKBP-type peptidyl-prolyl cis-trans isomerase FklB
MKTILIILLFPFSITFAQTKKPAQKTTAATPTAVKMSSTDSLSYSIGVQVAEYYKTQGVETVNADFVKKAFQDVYNNKTLLISEEECNMNIQQKLQEFMQKRISAYKEAGKKFL